MNKLLTFLTVLVLAGCSSVPVARHFPDVPEELTVACTDLQQTDPNTVKLSEAITVITSNYGQYHECRIKTDMWIDWYNNQKKIFDSVK